MAHSLRIHIDRNDRALLALKAFERLMDKGKYTLNGFAFQYNCKPVFVPQFRIYVRMRVRDLHHLRAGLLHPSGEVRGLVKNDVLGASPYPDGNQMVVRRK